MTGISELPQNIDAEQGLLGVIMYDNTALFEAQTVVKPEDFYYPAHGAIFEKCVELITDGNAANPVTMHHYFNSRPDFEDVGGGGYLAELLASVITSVNAAEYARIVADLSLKRRMLMILGTMDIKLSGGTPAKELQAELVSAIESESGESVFVKTKREVAMEVVQSLTQDRSYYSTGLPSLDYAMAGGLHEGLTYGFSGVEKSGKTTFAHTISHNLSKNDVPHAYIALEMGSLQIEQRNLAREIGRNSVAFLTKGDKTGMIRDANEVAEKTTDKTLYLDMPGCSLDQIKAELLRLVTRKQIKGFILDYWQLVGGAKLKQSKAEHLFDVAQFCADFSKRHGIWNIILAQVNREGSLFGSAGLEKACDQLYQIEEGGAGWGNEQKLYLNMRLSRSTPMESVGSKENPMFRINKTAGPYIEEITI